MPAWLLNVCFVLAVRNVVFFPAFYGRAGCSTQPRPVTPYLFLFDLMVLTTRWRSWLRIGVSEGFRAHELSALGLVAGCSYYSPAVGAPTGFAATLIVAGLIAGRVIDQASLLSMAKRTSSAELRTPSF